VDPKQTCEDAADKVLDWVGVAFLFILMMYGLTFGFDQAAPLFGLPQASPLEVGGLLLSVRLVVHEVRYLLLPLQLYLATVSGNCIWQLYLATVSAAHRAGSTPRAHGRHAFCDWRGATGEHRAHVQRSSGCGRVWPGGD
jgi:hypothetical protein